jgi:hypothetical protein
MIRARALSALTSTSSARRWRRRRRCMLIYSATYFTDPSPQTSEALPVGRDRRGADDAAIIDYHVFDIAPFLRRRNVLWSTSCRGKSHGEARSISGRFVSAVRVKKIFTALMPRGTSTARARPQRAPVHPGDGITALPSA